MDRLNIHRDTNGFGSVVDQAYGSNTDEWYADETQVNRMETGDTKDIAWRDANKEEGEIIGSDSRGWDEEEVSALEDYSGAGYLGVAEMNRNPEMGKAIMDAGVQMDKAIKEVEGFSARMDAGEDPLNFSPADKQALDKSLQALSDGAENFENVSAKYDKGNSSIVDYKRAADSLDDMNIALEDNSGSFDLGHERILKRAREVNKQFMKPAMRAINQDGALRDMTSGSIMKDNQPINVYRGWQTDNAKAVEALMSDDTFTSKAYLSTSLSPSTSRGFTTGGEGKLAVLFKIKAKSGAYVAPISNYKGEVEVVLPEGKEYRITSRRRYQEHGRQWIGIEAEEI